MIVHRDPDYLISLVHELRKAPAETEWLEFKENYVDPQEIGEYLSALSNGAALNGKATAYMLWGISNQTHAVVGTTFRPDQFKKGNEELNNWLLRCLSPRLHFHFHDIDIDGNLVVILEIPRASGKPVQFSGVEYIRVGSYKKKLTDFPEKERELWHIFDVTPFEELIAAENVSGRDVLELLDYPSYFDLLGISISSNREKILNRLANDNLIVSEDGGKWNITNLGAVLFAKNLDQYRGLKRKAIRVIQYAGDGRLMARREQVINKGYASGFEGLIGLVNALLPQNEVIGDALRKEVPMYPLPAIRELVPNALIHQDFSITGSGPMVEIFDSRMEVTNPGLPLVETDRFLDTPPRSRNEALASFMRRLGICEERGSGIDKVVFQTEFYQLPAPAFETVENNTRSVLFPHRSWRDMGKGDRIRACYLHACLRFVERNQMTNSSLRDRFGIEPKNSATISRIIRDTIDVELIKPFEMEQGKRHAKYIPFWA